MASGSLDRRCRRGHRECGLVHDSVSVVVWGVGGRSRWIRTQQAGYMYDPEPDRPTAAPAIDRKRPVGDRI